MKRRMAVAVIGLAATASIPAASQGAVRFLVQDDGSPGVKAETSGPSASFDFADVSGATAGSTVTSGTETLSGLAGPTNVSVSGDGSPEVSIAGGPWSTSGTIRDGEALRVRLRASDTGGATRTADVTVNGVGSDSWNVTSGAIASAACGITAPTSDVGDPSATWTTGADTVESTSWIAGGFDMLAGDDVLRVNGDVDSSFDMGAGADSVEILGEFRGHLNSDTTDGQGDTVVVSKWITNTVNLGDGDDDIDVCGSIDGAVSLAGGTDTVTTDGPIRSTVNKSAGSGSSLTMTTGDSVWDSITLGDGDDEIYINGNIDGSIDLKGGAGDLAVYGHVDSRIDASGTNGVTVYVETWVDGDMNFTDGDDTIEVGDTTYNVDLGAGSDSFRAGSDVMGAVNADSADTGGVEVEIGGDVWNPIDLGDGNDTVHVSGYLSGYFGHGGQDTVTVLGAASGQISMSGSGQGLDLHVHGALNGDVDDATDNDDRVRIGGTFGGSAIRLANGEDAVWFESYTASDWTGDTDGIQSSLSGVEHVAVGPSKNVVVGSTSAFSDPFFQ